MLVLVMLPLTALADSSPDQVCVGNPLTDGTPVTYQDTLHGQLFNPTLNTIRKVAIFGKSVNSQTAKVKLTIRKAWYDWGTSYSKTIVLNSDPWWVEADFGEVPVTTGVQYLLSAEPLNGAMVSWYVTDDPNCNPSGYAFYGTSFERDKDFYFSVRSENTSIQLEDPVVPPASTESTVTESSNTSATNPDSTPGADNDSVDQSTNSSVRSQVTQSSSSSNPTSFITDKEKANANKVLKSTGSLSDEELDDILKMIAEDYEKNHTVGMFGLSGMAGKILTPTVFYSFLGLIILFLVAFILLIIKIKNSSKQST